MESTLIGRIFSGIVSRWTLLAVIVVALAWNIHSRIDHIGAPKLQTTTISAAAAMIRQ